MLFLRLAWLSWMRCIWYLFNRHSNRHHRNHILCNAPSNTPSLFGNGVLNHYLVSLMSLCLQQWTIIEFLRCIERANDSWVHHRSSWHLHLTRAALGCTLLAISQREPAAISSVLSPSCFRKLSISISFFSPGPSALSSPSEVRKKHTNFACSE